MQVFEGQNNLRSKEPGVGLTVGKSNKACENQGNKALWSVFPAYTSWAHHSHIAFSFILAFEMVVKDCKSNPLEFYKMQVFLWLFYINILVVFWGFFGESFAHFLHFEKEWIQNSSFGNTSPTS